MPWWRKLLFLPQIISQNSRNTWRLPKQGFPDPLLRPCPRNPPGMSRCKDPPGTCNKLRKKKTWKKVTLNPSCNDAGPSLGSRAPSSPSLSSPSHRPSHFQSQTEPSPPSPSSCFSHNRNTPRIKIGGQVQHKETLSNHISRVFQIKKLISV